MVQLSRRRAENDDGVALLLVALSMVVVLAVAAFVVDIGNARQVRRHAQGGVDAAAVAAAQDLPVQSQNVTTRRTKQSQARNTAMIYSTRNLVGDSATAPTCNDTLQTTCTGTVDDVSLTVSTPWNPTTASVPDSSDPSYDSYLGFVYVQACQPTTTFFAGALGQESPDVCRSAVGRYNQVGGGYDFGLVATDPSQCGALTFAGNSETQLTSNGAVMVNSNCASGNTQALDSSGSSWKLRFVDDEGAEVPGYIGVVGGATLNPCDPEINTSCTQTVPTTGISPFGDPLAGLDTPSAPAGPAKTCDKDGGRISPGLYSSCNVTSNGANLQMEPGIYYIDGDMKFTGGDITCVDDTTTMKCTGTDPGGVLIFVTGQVTLTGNGGVALPPYEMSCTKYYTDTCYDGISIWQTGSSVATFNGTDDFSIGTVYVPNANLKANGSGGGEEIDVTGVVVAKTVEISGTFQFNIVVPETSPDPENSIDLGLEK
jgi:Flp pilus assembly protein TadG